MKPTPQQQAILDEIRDGTDNILIRARAGTGKTTAILMAVDVLRQKSRTLEVCVCAFNKAIADEVKAELNARGHDNFKTTQAATVHSLGFGLVRFVFRNPKVNQYKVRDIVDRFSVSNTSEVEPWVFKEFGPQIEKLVRVAKMSGVGFFDDMHIGDIGVWYELADHYDVNGFDDTSSLDIVIRAAQLVYRFSLDTTSEIDFDDMVLFPLVKNLRVKFQKDVLFVDEAQDLSRARQALIKKFVKPSGRVVIVGDEKQAIYGFSGADANALENLCRSLRAKVLPLSVTWRCPRSVVTLAQTIVPDIEAAPGASEGRVDYIGELPEAMGPETFILCRNTAPLIDIAYGLIRSGTPCKVEGRDIGEGLKTLLKRWKTKDLDDYTDRLSAYRDREVQKAEAKNRPERAESINDKCDTVMAIVDECFKRGLTTINDAVAFVDDLFADGVENVTTLATYHRSKGREKQRVILVEHDTRCPSGYAHQPWQLEQEDNLAYVAFTRAREELLFYTPKVEAA